MKFPIHPSAAIYPMMSKNELQDLADSIKEYGQYHPIELTEWIEIDHIEDKPIEKVVKGIIDGRNREQACEIADVEPVYKELNFDRDDGAIRNYVYESNRLRRSLSAGQLAMSYAMMFPKGVPGRPKKRLDKQNENKKRFDSETFSSDETISRSRLSLARKILDHSKEYAKAIMDGNAQFDATLTKVIKEQRERDKQLSKEAKEMAELREWIPDLIRDIESGDLPREDAIEEMKKLQKEERERIAAENRKRAEIFHALWSFTHNVRVFVVEDMSKIPELLKDPDSLEEFHKHFSRGVPEFLERIVEQEIEDAAYIMIDLLRKLRNEEKSPEATSFRVVGEE